MQACINHSRQTINQCNVATILHSSSSSSLKEKLSWDVANKQQKSHLLNISLSTYSCLLSLSRGLTFNAMIGKLLQQYTIPTAHIQNLFRAKLLIERKKKKDDTGTQIALVVSVTSDPGSL